MVETWEVSPASGCETAVSSAETAIARDEDAATRPDFIADIKARYYLCHNVIYYNRAVVGVGLCL